MLILFVVDGVNVFLAIELEKLRKRPNTFYNIILIVEEGKHTYDKNKNTLQL